MYVKASDDPSLYARVKELIKQTSVNRAAGLLDIGRPSLLAYDADRTINSGTVAQIRDNIAGAERAAKKEAKEKKAKSETAKEG